LIIQCDTRQKRKHHDLKERYFEEQGHKLVHSKMLVGDYCVPSNGSVVVDTKADLSELYSNLIQQHKRFRSECILAQEAGIKLYILVENKNGIRSVEDVEKWKNPQFFRYYKAKRKAERMGLKEPKPPASNVQLIKIMHAMTRDYGVEFLFCTPQESGSKVIELLTKGV
jgi:ribosome-associated protein